MAGGAIPVSKRQTAQPPPYRLNDFASLLHEKLVCESILAFADRHRRALLLIVLVFYLAAFNGQWRIQPDAALYLSIGRNLAEGKGYTYLGQPNRLAYPGWPVLIAGTFKVFGGNSLFAVNALMLLIALATLGMVYRLFLLHSGRSTAIVVTVGAGLTKAFFCYGFELWSDMPFALGVFSTLAGYEGVFGECLARGKQDDGNIALHGRTWRDWVCLIGGLAFAASMRPTIWPLLAALAIAVIIQLIRRQIHWRNSVAIAVTTVVVLGVTCFILCNRQGLHGFGGVYTDYLFNRLFGNSDDASAHPFSANIRDLFQWAASDVLFQTRLGPVCNSLLSLLVLGLGFGLLRYRALWGLWFCLLLATILVSQNALDRYFLPVLPLLVFGWWDLLVRINRSLVQPIGNVVFITLLAFGAISNITKVSGIVMQQRQQPFLASYDKGRFEVMPRFAKLLHDRVGERAVILAKAPYGRVTAYMSDRCVTNAASIPVEEMQSRPLFVIEPSDLATQSKLHAAGLVEGPALFTVTPSAKHGPLGIPLSLHPTKWKSAECKVQSAE